MEVILMQDVKSLGKKGDVVKVNDGYARNYIIPKKLGVEATKQNLNQLKLQKKAEAKRQKEILEEAKEFAEKLKDITVKLELKAGEGGRTFGSISSKEIATSVEEQFGLKLDRKKLQLSSPIKNPGTYNVPIKLHPQVTTEISVKVEAV